GPDQQPAGAATEDRQAPGRGPALLDEVLGAGDEVGEGVHLVAELAGLIPRPAHLAAAPDVADGPHEAPVEEAEAQGREAGVGARLVGPVAVEDAGRRPVAGDALPGHVGDRYPGAVGGGGPQPARLVARRVVAAEDGLLLEERALPGVEVVVEDRLRGDQRGV